MVTSEPEPLEQDRDDQEVTAPPSGHPEVHARHDVVVVEVVGLPAPQGSKRHVGRGVMVESSKRVRPWREAVKQATLDVRPELPFAGAVRVDVTFRLPRPQGHFRTGRNAHLLRDTAPRFPAGTPDADKLARSTLDALTDAGLWRDDAQVVCLSVWKRYAEPQQLVGASITVEAA